MIEATAKPGGGFLLSGSHSPRNPAPRTAAVGASRVTGRKVSAVRTGHIGTCCRQPGKVRAEGTRHQVNQPDPGHASPDRGACHGFGSPVTRCDGRMHDMGKKAKPGYKQGLQNIYELALKDMPQAKVNNSCFI